MKCVKCDICGRYVETWHEVDSDIFSYWKDNFTQIRIKDMCLNCKDKFQEEFKNIILKIKEGRTN